MSGRSENPARQLVLTMQREKEAAEHQKQREALLKESEKDHTADRFVGISESVDEQLKKTTVGLVTLSEFQKAKDGIEEEHRRLAAASNLGQSEAQAKVKRSKKLKAKLSFHQDEEGEEESLDRVPSSQKRLGEDLSRSASKKPFVKNPDVDTSFLPDRDREQLDRQRREEFRQRWLAKHEAMKNEMIEITYSYWDGAGHRKVVQCKKGDDIAAFLNKCRTQVPELRSTNVDNLMYIKEDLIIPHHYTFYDLIVREARGKSGPLFNFDVHDDIRLLSDATIEKDESHAGKVVERSWYNRFKHIFPASRWEIYDPSKKYGEYRVA